MCGKANYTKPTLKEVILRNLKNFIHYQGVAFNTLFVK